MRTPSPTRRRLADVGAVTLIVAVAAMVALDDSVTGFGSPAYRVASIVATACACVIVLWRRRFPVAVALVLLPFLTFTDMTGGAAVVALFAVAVHRPWRTTVWIAVAHVVVAVPFTIATQDSLPSVVRENLFGVAFLALAVAWGTLVRTRRELIDSLRERAERAESEAALEAEAARWRERERIAHEMHDVLAHRISLISLHSGALEVRSGIDSETQRSASTIRTAAHAALDDLRGVLGILRSEPAGPPRPEAGLAGLPELVSDAMSVGTTIRLTPISFDGMRSSSNRTAFRIVQEALTNARKHAPGAPVSIVFDREQDELHVSVRNAVTPDDVSPVPGSGTGLVGITERVRLAAGRVEHGIRRRDEGLEFAVDAWLPWNA
ncbi:sensor histidine kinase [Actinomycetes bacterium M1A6_2h]